MKGARDDGTHLVRQPALEDEWDVACSAMEWDVCATQRGWMRLTAFWGWWMVRDQSLKDTSRRRGSEAHLSWRLTCGRPFLHKYEERTWRAWWAPWFRVLRRMEGEGEWARTVEVYNGERF